MTRNPFEEIERMIDRMSGQFEALDEDLRRGSVAVDLVDAGDSFVVTADLPGYEEGDVDVELAGGTLTISAAREESAETSDGGRYVRRERRRRDVDRSVRLPEDVEPEGTDATYDAGVLTVTLPKARSDDGREIPIN